MCQNPLKLWLCLLLLLLLFLSKRLRSEQFLIQKQFMSKRNFRPKSVGSKIKFGKKKWSPKSFGPKKFRSKNTLSQKILGPKIFWVQQILVKELKQRNQFFFVGIYLIWTNVTRTNVEPYLNKFKLDLDSIKTKAILWLAMILQFGHI